MIMTTQSENHLLENRFLSSEKAGWVGCVEKVDLKKLNLKYLLYGYGYNGKKGEAILDVDT